MTAELIEEFGEQLESTTLVRGASGVFEVRVDGRMIFSKKEIGRHADPGEVVELMRSGQVSASPA